MTAQQPVENTKKPNKSTKSLRPLAHLLPYLGRYKGLVAGAAFFLLAAAITTLSLPVAVRRVIDFGFSGEDAQLVNNYFTVLLLVAGLLAAASALRYFFVISLGERIVSDLRRDVFAHVMTLSASFYDTAQSGEIVSRLTADTTQVKSAVGATASLALRNTILGIGALTMMVITSPWLAAIVIAAIPAIVLPIVWFGRRVRTRSRDAQDTLADATAYATEAIGAVRSFQAFTNETVAANRFSDAVEKAFAAARSSIGARSVLTGFGIFLVFASIVAVLWIGARSVMEGTMSPGTLSQFLLYAVFAAGALAALSETWGELQQAAGAAERLAELLIEEPAIRSPENPLALPAIPLGTVAFSTVSFAYPTRSSQPALHKIDFAVKGGETVAVVGPSGAGKSTLFGLLLRQYDPTGGTVTIDGINIAQADLTEVRNRIAIVPQDVTILSGTAAENIAFGSSHTDRQAVIAAAKAAQADEFIAALPQGYDTQVGERGITLSGGQRQRIAIARAILRDAPILLLDEATSALDAESEVLVQKGLERLMEGRTTLVIAHRLATILKADRILVLDDGRIVEEGTHAQLANKKNGVYAHLAKLQFNAGRDAMSDAAE